MGNHRTRRRRDSADLEGGRPDLSETGRDSRLIKRLSAGAASAREHGFCATYCSKGDTIQVVTTLFGKYVA
jgi:hypothetical protein